MPTRVSSFMELYWSIRHVLPRDDLPTSSWKDRLAIGVTFGCLRRFKLTLIDAKKITDDTQKGAERRKSHIPTALLKPLPLS